MTILISDFPAYVTALELNPPPLVVIAPLLTHARPAVRKRATQTLAQFVPLSSQDLFDGLLASNIRTNLAPTVGLEQQRTVVNLVAAIARVSPQRIAPALPEVVPAILKALGRDDDELRESSLQVRTSFDLRTHVLTSTDVCSGFGGNHAQMSYGSHAILVFDHPSGEPVHQARPGMHCSSEVL